ncbi:SICA antigen [Plasmodium coatneyi]|uniref:SICA antigen n=1 Tax=Plasmodium coatneyi TaxID=208452 RepID=A0A1B1DUS2_9APIC|nr:SICA antigen [Plasmodium coatneyi]ANQ06512.1 SICA antigen [Plasmodium coatneyi]
MTAGQFYFLSNEITRWVMEKGMNDVEKIGEKIKKDLKKTFENLLSRLGRQESGEIYNLCYNNVKWSGNPMQELDMQTLCQGIMEIRYFMNGIKTKRKSGSWNDDVTIEKIPDDEAYRRCLVGMISMLEFYKEHCRLEFVIKAIEAGMKEKLEGHKNKGAILDRCKGVDITGLILGKTAVADEIKKWAQVEKNKRESGIRRVGHVKRVSEGYCENEQSQGKLEETVNKNLEIMTSLLGIENRNKLKVLTDNDNKYTLSQGELETALEPATNGSKNIDDVIQNLKKEIQQKIQRTDPPSPLPRASPNGGGIGAALAAALSVPGTAIPVVAGVIALPAFLSAFFLYKIFFFKKHNLYGGRRKKRSTFRHELNSLWDNEDSSIEYSRSNLMESVIGTDSATEYSGSNLTEYLSEYSIPYTSSSI